MISGLKICIRHDQDKFLATNAAGQIVGWNVSLRSPYPGAGNDKFPNRIDPRDPRTDWKSSTEVAFSWLQNLDAFYRGQGFRPTDAMMLALSAYNQGQGEVGMWIAKAKARYGIKDAAALTFPMVYGGAMDHLGETSDLEKRRMIQEGMGYAAKVVGAYLAAAPQLDERGCR